LHWELNPKKTKTEVVESRVLLLLLLFVVEGVEVLMWNVVLHEMKFSFDCENDENLNDVLL
jgi:hypothetical protein